MTIENIINYFKLLRKKEEQEQISNYKLEIAKFLSNSDYFIFKTKFILSIVGMGASILLVLVILWEFSLRGYYFYEMRYLIYFGLYVGLFVFTISFFTYRKLMKELNSLRKMIEE